MVSFSRVTRIRGTQTVAEITLGPQPRPRPRVWTAFAAYGAAKAGLGVATLPCFMGDPESGLARVTAPDPELASALWLLTHQDLRATARVRAFLDFMAQSLASDIDLLEGDRGG